MPAGGSLQRIPFEAPKPVASQTLDNGHRAIIVRATDLSGNGLETARIRRLDTARGTGAGIATDVDVPVEVRSLLISTLHTKDAASSRLGLEPEELPCFVLLEAEGHETTLLHLGAVEGDVAVPLHPGARIEIDAGLLHAAGLESGMLSVWPTALAADGSRSNQDLVLTARAPNLWAVAVRKEMHVTMASRSLQDLPRGQPFEAFLVDDRRRVQFEPLQVVAPGRLDFVWRRVEGCTLVFSVPLPTSGTIVFTPNDRRHDEPLLGGDLPLAEGTTSAFVPCAAGRPWFLDGCGVGWQFAAPFVVEPSRGDTLQTVELRDASRILAIIAEGSLDPNDVQILLAKGLPHRRTFELVTLDPMASGPRMVRDARGWIIRDMSPTLDLFAYLEPCNALLPLDAAGRTSVGVRKPETRPGFHVPEADREALRAELLSIPQGDPWVHLDQWLPTQEGGTWFPTTSRQLRRDQLLSGTLPIPGILDSRYRLRVMLPGREWIVPLK